MSRAGARSIAAALVCLTGLAPPAVAGDSCTDGLCTADEAQVVAEISGAFRHGFGIAATEIDLRAALEQQRWREFRFVANAAARVYATLDLDPAYRPENWPADAPPATEVPRLTLLASTDGSHYRRIENGDPMPEGAILSVVVGQPAEVSGSRPATSYPGRWPLRAPARRTWAAGETPSSAAGAPLSPLPADPLPEFDPLAPDPDVAAASVCEAGSCVDEAPPDNLPPHSPDPVEVSALASELQAELARVGCYTAVVDGIWGPASRRAVADFNIATGAGLMSDAPTPRALVAVARTQEPVCSPD